MENGKQMLIAILYSEAEREYFPTEEQYLSEAEVRHRAELIAPYFEKIGFKTKLLPGSRDLPDRLRECRPDLVLNLVDSVRGQEHLAAIIPATLELFNIPYIGTGTLGLALNSNKFLTKKLMEQAGLPLPRYQLFNAASDPLDAHLKFPLISKLNEIHGSIGIDQDSVSENEAHLRNRLKNLMNTYRQAIIVEEFIVGKELTVYLLEGSVKKIYLGEKVFRESEVKYKIATFDAVWRDINSYDYARSQGHGILENYVRSAFDVLKMDDYAKFDLRQDESGRYYFIDCNANPAFGPLETNCAVSLILKLYGINFDEIIRRLVINASKEEPALANIKFNSNVINSNAANL